MKFKFILVMVFSLIINKSHAQDPIFTQFYLVPETLNPAFTGISNTWNAGVIHRRQWPDGNRRIDTQFGFANNLVSDEIGIGISVLNHTEVFTGYNYFKFNGAFAYRIDLDNDWRLRLGLEAGYGRKDFNFNNLLLEDQININTGAINPGSIDPGVMDYSNNINFADFSAGFVMDQENAWFGVAVKHLNRPDISFRENANVPLDLFLTVHGGYFYEFLNSPTSLIPEGTNLLITGNYMRQGQYNRLDIGTVMDYSHFSFGIIAAINPEGRTSSSHMVTSLNPVLSFKSSEFTFGYSYDWNTSRIGNTQGVHEFSLTWQSSYRCDRCDNYKVKLKRNGEAGYQKM